MIVIGYQGIGKSSLSGSHLGYIDLESSNFFVDGKRDENWYKVYCSIAKHLSQQGFKVFISSHEVVRRELKGCNEDVVVIYPDLKLKDEWIEKLRLRYESTLKNKDYKAWKNAEDRYEDNIKELMAEDSFDHIVIEDMNYSLRWLLMNREIKR